MESIASESGKAMVACVAGPPSPLKPIFAGAGDGADLAIGTDFAHAVIHGVGEIDASIGPDDGALGPVKQGRRGGAAIAIEVGAARDRRDSCRRHDHADAFIPGIDNIDVVECVGGKSGDLEKRASAAELPSPAKPSLPSPAKAE